MYDDKIIPIISISVAMGALLFGLLFLVIPIFPPKYNRCPPVPKPFIEEKKDDDR